MPAVINYGMDNIHWVPVLTTKKIQKKLMSMTKNSFETRNLLVAIEFVVRGIQCTNVTAHSHQEKAKTKVKIFFDI